MRELPVTGRAAPAGRRKAARLRDAHVHNAFQAKDTSATLDTMWADAYVNSIPC